MSHSAIREILPFTCQLAKNCIGLLKDNHYFVSNAGKLKVIHMLRRENYKLQPAGFRFVLPAQLTMYCAWTKSTHI